MTGTSQSNQISETPEQASQKREAYEREDTFQKRYEASLMKVLGEENTDTIKEKILPLYKRYDDINVAIRDGLKGLLSPEDIEEVILKAGNSEKQNKEKQAGENLSPSPEKQSEGEKKGEEKTEKIISSPEKKFTETQQELKTFPLAQKIFSTEELGAFFKERRNISGKALDNALQKAITEKVNTGNDEALKERVTKFYKNNTKEENKEIQELSEEEFKNSDFINDFGSTQIKPEYDDFNKVLARNYIRFPVSGSKNSEKKVDKPASLELSLDTTRNEVIEIGGDQFREVYGDIIARTKKATSLEEKYLLTKKLFEERQRFDNIKKEGGKRNIGETKNTGTLAEKLTQVKKGQKEKLGNQNRISEFIGSVKELDIYVRNNFSFEGVDLLEKAEKLMEELRKNSRTVMSNKDKEVNDIISEINSFLNEQKTQSI